MTARLNVSAPARAPAGYGLLAAASVVPFTSDRELHSGVQYETVGCVGSELLTYTCAGGVVLPPGETASPGGNKVIRSGPPALIQGEPFVVYDSFWCGPRDDARAIAQQRLAIGAGCAVERAFQTGVANPVSLMDATLLTSTPLEVTEAMALLQEAMPTVGGIIHGPRGAGALLAAAHQITAQGATLRDILGNAVALYTCWERDLAPASGTAVVGEKFWMFATGPVTVRRGEVITSPPGGFGFDAANNDMLILVEQPYIITVECGVFAVPVTADITLGLPRRTPPEGPAGLPPPRPPIRELPTAAPARPEPQTEPRPEPRPEPEPQPARSPRPTRKRTAGTAAPAGGTS